MATEVFIPIQTYTLASSQASITFSSIPGTYQDLVIIGRGVRNIAGSGSNGAPMQFNGDSGSNYNSTITYGVSGTYGQSSVYSTSTPYGAQVGDPNHGGNANFIQIFNYASNNIKKTWLNTVSNAENGLIYSIAGSWNTSNVPITSIQFNVNSGENFGTYTQFTLYGR
jgi:hypothetical protein